VVEASASLLMSFLSTLMIWEVKGFVSALRMSGGFSPVRPGDASMSALESVNR